MMTILTLRGDRMISHDAPYSFELQAYYDKKKRIYNFPICGDIIRRLDKPDIDPGLRCRLLDMCVHQDLLLDVKKDYSTTDDRLFPDQRSGVNWLTTIKRGILADDQGTGKTVVALAASSRVRPARILIVCSKIKRKEWVEHVKEWTDSSAEIFADQTDWTGYMVAHYHAAVDNKFFMSKTDMLIVDEAHIIRNRKTGLFKAMRTIARKAEYVFLLTASPTVNTISDFWPLLCICDEKRFGSYWGFAFRFCEIQLNTIGMKVGNTKEEEKENLLNILNQYVLSREYSENLPEPEWMRISYTIPDAQRILYSDMEKDMICSHESEECIALTPLSQITRLRQLILHPALIFPGYVGGSKIDELIPLIQGWGGQTLVFSQYAELSIMVANHLNLQGISATYLTSTLTDKQKNESLDAFHAGKFRVIAMTYKMGGEGLNFVTASQAIFLEYAWNPATMRHAYKRILRRGQKNKDIRFVTIHAEGTIEDHIWEILQEKRKVTLAEILQRRALS